MVDIATWRAIIGIWNAYKIKTNSGFDCFRPTILQWLMAGICLCFLMIIGGIEQNPGPFLRSHKENSMAMSKGNMQYM